MGTFAETAIAPVSVPGKQKMEVCVLFSIFKHKKVVIFH
jgi:hypothetical protein